MAVPFLSIFLFLKVLFLIGGFISEAPESLLAVKDNLATWCGVSEECKSFVLQLLHTDPITRLNASEALRHAWFTSGNLTFPKTSDRNDRRSVRSVGSSRSGGSSVQSLRVSGHRRVQVHHLEALSSDPEVAAML